jgi:hypothetical protein
MCTTIDPGSCIRWVLGFGIKIGYDTNPYKNYALSPQDFWERVQKGKEMVRTGEELGKIGRWHYSTLAGSALHKGDTKWRCDIQTLISLYIRNGRCARFHDKKRRVCFRDGRRNGRCAHFCDKRRRAPRNTRLLYLHNRRCVIWTRVSLLSKKRVRLGY